MKSCGLGFVSWKAVCTAVEASVGLARARIRRGARSGRALGDSSRGVGDMGEAAWRGWKPGRGTKDRGLGQDSPNETCNVLTRRNR